MEQWMCKLPEKTGKCQGPDFYITFAWPVTQDVLKQYQPLLFFYGKRHTRYTKAQEKIHLGNLRCKLKIITKELTNWPTNKTFFLLFFV